MGPPDHWFFILAKDPEQAIDLIDCEWGEPDARSLCKVDGPVAFQFVTRLDDGDEEAGKFVECSPDEPVLSLGEGVGYEGAHDWIKERMLTPFAGPAAEDYRAMHAVLGKKMSQEWRQAVHEPTEGRGDIGDTTM